ncbi:hypothetical protein F5X98DRAFT_357806 [Xylaria grammica]|nr:hypothetical protein F5X98DRAFT_357806 [Xylaria grammica]
MDHKVFDDILFPAVINAPFQPPSFVRPCPLEAIYYIEVGVLVMAIEASRVISDSKKSLGGFRFSDVFFKQALKVPSGGGVESHFYLRQRTETNLVHGRGWKEFQLFTSARDEWLTRYSRHRNR